MEPQLVVMDSAGGGVSPKSKKRRKFWRLRRQKETDRDNSNEDTRSASDGRISPQDEEDVAELLTNPWLVSRQWDRLSPAVQEEEEETSKVRVLAALYKHHFTANFAVEWLQGDYHNPLWSWASSTWQNR